MASPSVRAIGQDAAEFFANWPALAEICYDKANNIGELTIEKDGATRIFEVANLAMQDSRGRYNGMSIVFHDVTERKAASGPTTETTKSPCRIGGKGADGQGTAR